MTKAILRLLFLSALTLSTGAKAALEIGATAPAFTLPAATAGQVSSFNLLEALKTGPVILYFFPAAFTSGCNREAHAFAEHMAEFKSLKATVIGVSNDEIGTLEKFSVQECAGQFPVAADPDSRVIKAYDVKFPAIGKAQRVSYIISPEGKISYVYSALTDPEGHISNTLKALKGP